MSSHKRRRSSVVLIDWFTVAAQALNFLILVWLLKKVLYRPIMSAIDAREALVAAELADAASKKSVADKAVEEFKSKNEAFDRDRAALLAKATQDAKLQGAQLLEVAGGAADALRSKRRDALQREMEDFSQALGGRAQQAFFALARRAFKDLANESLEEQMTALFCAKIRSIPDEDKKKLGAAIETSSEPVSVRSAFALPMKQQSALQTALNESFQRQIPVRYEVAAALIGGIELTAQGQRLVWSIADYIAALEREIGNGTIAPDRVALTAVA
jgi:F-type H+-transporting ATPase subunit b